MKTQVLTAVLALTTLSTTGCCGLRNILFGRGAACGTCASDAPALNIAPPAMPSPCGGACGPAASPYAGEPGCGYEGATSYAPAFDGGIIGTGLPYGGVGNPWTPRGEFTVPGSTFYSEGAPPQPMTPSTNMGSVSP